MINNLQDTLNTLVTTTHMGNTLADYEHSIQWGGLSISKT